MIVGPLFGAETDRPAVMPTACARIFEVCLHGGARSLTPLTRLTQFRSPLSLISRLCILLRHVHPHNTKCISSPNSSNTSELPRTYDHQAYITNLHARHPWSHVVIGMWRKYPNPKCSHVVSVDVVDRSIDPETGIIRTERILGCKQKAPRWIVKVRRVPYIFFRLSAKSCAAVVWWFRRCLCAGSLLHRPR